MAVPVRRKPRVTQLGTAADDILEEQPELSASVDESGLWTITQVFACDFDSVLRLCPRPYSQNKTFPFALLTGIDIERGEANRAELTCTYKGLTSDFQQPGGGDFSTGGRPAGATTEIINTTGEEPIETHPNYDSLASDELKAIQAYVDGPASAPKPLADNAVAQQLIKKKLKGINSYLCAGMTYRMTWNTTTLPSLTGAGFKVTAPSGAPPLPSGQNWLFIGITAKQQGGAYEVSSEWRASGRDGWDADLYQASA